MKNVTTPGEALLSLNTATTPPTINTRLLAKHLGRQHESIFRLLTNYYLDFEQFGKVRFQIGPSDDSRTGQSAKFAWLNEDQTYLLLTFSRNNAKVRQLKVRLVKAFQEARLAADTHKTEYLPTYHLLHDGIHRLASGSSNERFVHANINKLVNKTAGIEAGQRGAAPLAQKAVVIVAQAVAIQAMRDACDHHDGYQRVKAALQKIAPITLALPQISSRHGQ